MAHHPIILSAYQCVERRTYVWIVLDREKMQVDYKLKNVNVGRLQTEKYNENGGRLQTEKYNKN